jgi:signal transduction histidine kinase
LPQGSEVSFKELTIFEQYKWRIITALTFCFLQSFLIAGLLAERRRRHAAQRKLLERLVFETLLSELSAEFTGLPPHQIDRAIETWLQRFANFLGARAGHLDTVSKDAPAQSSAADALALAIPIHVDTSRWMLTFSPPLQSSRHVWPEDLVPRLRVAGEILAGALIRNDASQQLQLLSKRLLESQDQERRRIARELHDGTAQNLCAILLNLRDLESKASLPDQLRQAFSECHTLCEQSLQELRTLSYLLHPPLLDEAGLSAALQWYLKGFVKRTGINVELVASQDARRLPENVEMDLFRVVQECLANIHRHSKSRTAQIRMERQASQIVLLVRDQGQGMSTQSYGVGLTGMAQRLGYLGGHLGIESSSQGTTITAVVPLPKES